MPKVTKAIAREREKRAVAYALQGKTFEEIAQLIGYASRGAAYDCYMRAIQRDMVRDVELIRETEVRRIDEMLGSIFPQALEGDVKSAECVIKLMAERRRYVGGLEVPTKIEAKVENVTPDEFKSFMAGAWEAFQSQSETRADA